MDSLLTYIVQVNMLLSVVYIGYYALLKSLTFYKLNRLYFLLGAMFSLIYPFLDIRSWFQRHVEPVGELVEHLPFWTYEEKVISGWTIENGIYLLIGVGGGFLLGKLLLQLVSLLRIHLHSVEASWKSYLYRNVLFQIVPFSFFNRIYLNKEQHQDVELYDIFEHEDIHVKGLHTIDVLFFELLSSVCWYNPFVWLIRKAVRQNLEFLTDQQVLNKGVCRQAYQYSLLNVSKQGAAVGISNQFNFKLLKKRIMMMNKKRSSRLELSKYAFLLPIMIFVAGAFTISKADNSISEVVDLARETEVKGIWRKPDTTKLVFVAEGEKEERFEAQANDTTKREEADGENKLPFLSTIRLDGSDQLNGKPKESGPRTIHFTPSERKELDINQVPLIVVDGERKPKGYQATQLNASDIESIQVWKKESAVVKYGEDGANGVVEVTMKNKTADRPVVRSMGVFTARDTTSQWNIRVKNENTDKEPLFVVDGVRKEAGMMKSIDPNSIESVSVLRDKSAETLYGETAKDGVVVITTKIGKELSKRLDKGQYSDDDVFFVDGKVVSKNEFRAMPYEAIEVETAQGPSSDGKGVRREIITKK